MEEYWTKKEETASFAICQKNVKKYMLMLTICAAGPKLKTKIDDRTLLSGPLQEKKDLGNWGVFLTFGETKL